MDIVRRKLLLITIGTYRVKPDFHMILPITQVISKHFGTIGGFHLIILITSNTAGMWLLAMFLESDKGIFVCASQTNQT